MGRLLKLVATVVVFAAGGGVALAAGSTHASGASRVIICPLERGGTLTYPCCGPPIATTNSAVIPCCGTPEPINCPVGMTASSSPNPSTAGGKVTVSGSWTGGTAGQTAVLWEELPGAQNFSRVAHTDTDSLGQFQFVRDGVQTNRQWYVSVGSEHSLTIEQQVVAYVTVTPGGANDYHGRVTPNHAGQRVWVERLSGSTWIVIARPRLSSKSTFSFRHNLCNTTSRVLFPGDRRNVRSPSATMKSSCGSVRGT